MNAQFTKAVLTPDANLPDGLTDGAGRPAGRRFAVYRNNVAVSLREALETGFPAVCSLLGAENFANVARMFLHDNPPDDPRMMFYGKGFPDFLGALPALSHLGYLGDVARLELALRDSYHAADADPIPDHALQALTPEDMPRIQLRLAPSLRLLSSPWPVVQIWQRALNPQAPKPAPVAEDVLITRPAYDPQPHALPSGAAHFIHSLAQAATLEDALDPMAEDFDPSPILALLHRDAAITQLTLK
ncbi:putative DNA-binding domain-containing protein [Sagittula sp. SSi028]|uniref:HvfC/BufC family peptide modification chaperone n=1 Tax=Sagittula sp. SSi028 TaxID=3400636 RepID=UPI003AF411EF